MPGSGHARRKGLSVKTLARPKVLALVLSLATLPKDGPTGTFQDRSGTVPW